MVSWAISAWYNPNFIVREAMPLSLSFVVISPSFNFLIINDKEVIPLKAFSSAILSESTSATPSIRIYDENYVPTLLEQDDMLLQKEIDAKRKMMIGLLESLETDVIEIATRKAADDFKKIHDERTALNENVIDPYTDDESGYIREMDDTIARFNIRRHEYEFEAIGRESMIFASEATDTEKFEKLQAMNEAIGAKVKKIFYNTIAKIKEIFAKFMEKLRGNFTSTKNYLDKYKNIILQKPFSNDEYGTKNLKDGIKNIENQQVKRLDLASMNDKLDSVDGAFDICFTVNRGNADISTIENQAKFWKSAFGMEGPENRITGKQFQQDIRIYWDFLYDIRKIEQTIKKSIKDIEDTCNNVMKQAGADVEKPEATPQNASTVYSYLYQKDFILENGVLHELDKYGSQDNTQPASTGNNPAAGDNAQASYSSRMKNVDNSGNDPDNVGTAKKSGRPIMDTRCQNYTNVATTMLKAKMSACEFIRSECMGIIRNEVQKYIGGGTNQTPPPQQNDQQQQQTQQNNQSEIDARNARAAEYSARVANRGRRR